MNCYNHEDKPASGVCRACGKGLCRECIAEVPGGIACRNHCEKQVETINYVIDINKQSATIANSRLKMNMIFFIIMGAVSGLIGVVDGNYFFGALAILMCILGLLGARPKYNFPEQKK